MHRISVQDDHAPRRKGRPALRLALCGVAALGLFGTIGHFAADEPASQGAARAGLSDPRTRPFVPTAAVHVRPAIAVAASAPRYRLDDPDALDPVRVEPARINPTTGQREDQLSQGSFIAGEAPYLRITVSEGAASPASLFVTIARRAADGQGLAVVRTGERGLIETKFGPVETLEATLSGPVTRICTGFSNAAQAGLAPLAPRFDGWLCAPLGQPPEPRAIACALDKLTLNGQASANLEAAYRAFEDRRVKSCASAVADAPRREPGGETGSISKRRLRHNEAKLRRTAQARP